jgi:RNA recognition motif-containing protein
MPVRLFVGNLPYETSEAELRQHFAAVGSLSHVFIPVDRETGRPRGFAFVEFAERPQAEAAINRLNNQPFKGRPLSVSEARAREDRPAGGTGYRPPMGSRPPGGAPHGEWTPRPPGGGPAAPAVPGEPRRREFGPDAPRRGKGKTTKGRREDKPTGPIPIRTHGRIYDVDAVEDETTEEIVEFDDFAKSDPGEKDEEK